MKEKSKVHHPSKDQSRTLSHQPDISFIIPVFNMADTLPEMLEALFQFRAAASEVIVVDDGSTDHVDEVIRNFSEKAEKIGELTLRNVHIPNRGRAGAINRGVEHAEGEYISFADADDVVDTVEFRKLWECCRLQSPDIAIGSFKIEKGGKAGFTVRTIRPETTNQQLIQKIAYSPLAPMHLNAALIRKELFLRLGGFDETLLRAQDKDLTIRLLKETGKIAICDAVPYIYRTHRPGAGEKVGKRMEWMLYRQKVLLKHFSGVRLAAAMGLQILYDILKLGAELLTPNRRRS